jgi:hypothetical protein
MSPGPITTTCIPPCRENATCEIKVFTKAEPRDREIYPVEYEFRYDAFDQEVERLMLLKKQSPDFQAVVVQLRNEWGGVTQQRTIGEEDEHANIGA